MAWSGYDTYYILPSRLYYALTKTTRKLEKTQKKVEIYTSVDFLLLFGGWVAQISSNAVASDRRHCRRRQGCFLSCSRPCFPPSLPCQ